ncbi:MAG: hypothetical protein ACOCUW_01425, partial [Gemmatimonadota bacterium]
MARLAAAGVLSVLSVASVAGQEYTRADTLRGSIGPERAWWDVTFYDLRVRVMPADSSIRGRVGIVYRVTEPAAESGPGTGSGAAGARTMQIDLQPPLVVDSVLWRDRALEHRRDGNVVRVEVPEARPGAGPDTVVVYYGGRPRVAVN